jgi:hypothetical protein
MEYEIRPRDHKHPVVLPVGHEAEFKIKNDRMSLKVPDGDRKKREYEVVAAKLVNRESSTYPSAGRPAENAADPSR